MLAIAVSSKDTAGVNVKAQLIESGLFRELDEFFDAQAVYSATVANETVKLYTTAADTIFCNDLDKKIAADIFVFATRHASGAQVHALTMHSIGNWGKAEFGGKQGTLVPATALLMKIMFKNLVAIAAAKNYEHDVVQEATHHGPFLEKAAVFIEIGSNEEEYKNTMNGKIIAETIINSIKHYNRSDISSDIGKKIKSVVAVGGMHYAQSFRKLMLDGEYSVAYVCPKHALPLLNEQLLRQAVAKCVPKAELIALDWKGMGQEKQRILHLAQSIGLQTVRV